ncbi:MAG TPA: chemotaxis protein CheW [Terracidiphilus sp.]|nr:chemotaxis protein CheW [Terracidiphilus sp.]
MSSLQTTKNRADNPGMQLNEICSVRLDQSLLGVPIRHILEIVGSACPQPVPLAPAFIGGIVHYRGDVLTAVSLRYLLGLPAVEKPQSILVLESSAGTFGLLVDSVDQVMNLSAADFEPNPSTVNPQKKDLFAGTYKLNDRLLVMLNTEHLDPVRLAAVQAT